MTVFVSEEGDPVLGRVEDVRVEDQVRQVFPLAGDVDATETHLAVVCLMGGFL